VAVAVLTDVITEQLLVVLAVAAVAVLVVQPLVLLEHQDKVMLAVVLITKALGLAAEAAAQVA